MLTRLGLDAAIEAVYRGMLAEPSDGVTQLTMRLGLSEEQVRSALNTLGALTLVRSSTEDDGQMRAVSPRLGMEILLAHQQAALSAKQAELAAEQQRLDDSRAAAAELVAEHAFWQPTASESGLQYVEGIESIRDHLEGLHSQIREELLTFAPGGPQTPANMLASRPLNAGLLARGVNVRTVYLDSIRRDPPTMAHGEWLESQGAHVRTVASLPNRMILVDRRAALIAADAVNTGVGAIVVTSPGMIAMLSALFDHVWELGAPLGDGSRPEPEELTRQQAEALRLMANGRTDESIATSLGVSTRTARRITNGLLQHLEARSRFEAGVRAVQLGYLPAVPS